MATTKMARNTAADTGSAWQKQATRPVAKNPMKNLILLPL